MAKPIIIAALYKFVPLPDYRELQPRLKEICRLNHVKGTLLLADEGINGTIAGSRQGIDAVLAFLKNDGRFFDLELKESEAEDQPFHRMKVRLKKEIVTLGMPGIKSTEQGGTYVSPQEWNALLQDPEVIVIDTRNQYEVEIGTFKGALNPRTRSFTEFPHYVKQLDPQKYKKIAMFCTGGIRCEKASSYMLSQGFQEVYHLKGGILKYLETIPEQESLWQGECFVFDGRIAVKQGVKVGHYESCHGCRHPISEEDKSSPYYERGVTCPHCYHQTTEEKRASARERQRQEDLARLRGEKHIGAEMSSL